MSQASLAYRKNEDRILRGDVPEKYLRILPHIPGQRILEIGSAECVLALLLAKQGKQVIAVEKDFDRHMAGINLQKEWGVSGIRHVNGPIGCHLDLLDGVDTLVAVRVIYYLRDDLDTVFAEVAKKIPNVVLCGNRNRAIRWGNGIPDDPGGPHNYYASEEGMTDLLTRHGYEIVDYVDDGDEIVVGRK